MLYDQTTVVDVTLDQAAVSKMNDLVYQDPRNECGGFLIGRVGRDESAGTFTVQVCDVYCEPLRGSPAGFTFTNDYQIRALLWTDHNHPDAHILGNFHSHAGFNAFFSPRDRQMMEEQPGEGLYLVISPSHQSMEAVFKDSQRHFYPCALHLAQPMDNPDLLIGKAITSAVTGRPAGGGQTASCVTFRAQPHFTSEQAAELAKRFNYSLDQLQDKKVLVVGAGTIGNLLVQSLTLSGVGSITIVDNGLYETCNLPRSPMVDRFACSKPKATELARAAAQAAVFPLEVTGIQADICTLGWGFLEGFDLILSPVDSVAVRVWIDRGAHLYRIPHITAGSGLAPGGGLFGNVLFFPSRAVIDLEQAWGHDSYRNHLEKRRSCANYQEDTQPQVIGFSARLAGAAMDLAIAQLLGRVADQTTVLTCRLQALGQGTQQDRASFEFTQCSIPRPSLYSDLSLVEGKPLYTITFDPSHSKEELYQLFRRAFQEERPSSSYTLDLEGLALVIPVAYRMRQPRASIYVGPIAEADPTFLELPPRHRYQVWGEGDESYYVELVLAPDQTPS